MMNLSPENRLLVSCVQAGISQTAANKMKDTLKLPLLWKEFLSSAFWHGVAPLVYRNLKDLQESLIVPPEVMEQLKEAYYATLARNMLLYAELERVLESFHEEGFEVILLKGAALAKTVYADIGTRPMGDIDIMVKKEDLPKAEERLSALGYVFHGGNAPEWWREHYCHIGYIHPEQSVIIELHWHLTSKKDISRIHDPDSGVPEGLWKKACHREPFGDNVCILSPKDSLHHLCIHFLKHRFPYSNNRIFTSKGALRQISDMMHLLKYYEDELDRETLVQGAGLQGSYGLIEFVVLLVQEIMGDGISSGLICNYYRVDGADQSVLELMSKKIFVREETRTGTTRLAIDSLSEVTFREKVRKIFGAVFPAPEVISKRYAVPLSSRRLYLYYLKRPLDLFLEHKRIISEIPRMKDDVILNRWIHSRYTGLATED